jgi:hypothetical protein
MANALTSVAKAIGSIAPTLASMLGGPLAGTAVAALEKALGLAPGAGPEAITAAVQTMSPETIAAVRAADQHHEEVIGQQKIDLAKLNADSAAAFAKVDADDRDSARRRETAVRDYTPRIIAGVVVALTFGLEGALILGWHKPSGIPGEVLGRILGTLDSALILVLGYYFGSSAGARASGEALAEIAKQP